jgi:hypothetical protein
MGKGASCPRGVVPPMPGRFDERSGGAQSIWLTDGTKKSQLLIRTTGEMPGVRRGRTVKRRERRAPGAVSGCAQWKIHANLTVATCPASANMTFPITGIGGGRNGLKFHPRVRGERPQKHI